MTRTRGKPGKQQLEAYRRMLLEKKAQVLSSLGVKFDALAAMGRVAEDDQAQMFHDEFVSLSLNSIDYQQLGLLEEALDRVKLGDYGTCQGCGDLIPAKRLRAVPWTRYCVVCQERWASPPLPGEPTRLELPADV